MKRSVNPDIYRQGHYFIEGQRISSKLGGGMDNPEQNTKAGGPNGVNFRRKREQMEEGIVRNLKFLGEDGQILTAGKSGKIPPGQIRGGGNKTAEEKFIYYYHPDHLGSTSYVTDASGEVYQHIEYFAFGETFIEERSNPNEIIYKFNAKELDDETGLYYYGARYYDPRISVFYGVDALGDLFTSISPYAYSINNPINLVDPDGNRPWPVQDKYKGWSPRVDSWFGPRNVKDNPSATKSHKGLDINFGSGYDDYGAPVLTTHDGKVVKVKDDTSGNGGRSITVESPDGKFRTSYFHLSDTNVKEGQQVKEGQTIGGLGASAFNSENGTASHLHYAIEVLNPETGNFEWYDPTQGKGNEIKNIVDPQKWIKKESSSRPNNGVSPSEKFTYSAPQWAKDSKLGAHIYFFFTGKDSGLPDQTQN